MEIRQLKSFRTIAYLGSFQEAAKTLFYAQSTISEQIKNLENEVGTKLFIRNTKKIVVCQFIMTGLTGLGDTPLKWLNLMMLLSFTWKGDWYFSGRRQQRVGGITSLFLKG